MNTQSGSSQARKPLYSGLLAPLLILIPLMAGSPPAFALTGFTFEAALVNPDPTDANFALFGVALSGDIAMISGTGRVHVFERINGTWGLVETLTDASNPLNFGNFVALEGNTAVITSPPGGFAQTRYFVYVRESGAFVRKTELVANAPVVMTRAPAISNGRIMLPGGTVLFGATRYALLYEMPAGGWPANTQLAATSTVDLGVDINNPNIPHFDDLFDNNGTSVPTMAYSVPGVAMKVREFAMGGWPEVATLIPSGPVASIGLIDVQGDTVLASALVDNATLDYQIYAYQPPAGGWIDSSEDAAFSVGTPNQGLFFAAIDDTTLVARGIFRPNPDPDNHNTLFIFDRAPGTPWASSSAPAEQLNVPGDFNRFVVDRNTILAGRFVYAAPNNEAAYSISDSLNDPSDRLLDYGQVLIGDQVAASVIVTNTSANPLESFTIGTPVAPALPFSIGAENCFGQRLSGGQVPPESCAILVHFSPVQTGFSGSSIDLPITTLAAGMEIATIDLTGTGVTNEADIGISKTGEAVILPDGTLGAVYTINVRNVAGATVEVMVEDRLPARVEFVDAVTSQGGDYDPDNDRWYVGVLAEGDDAELVITTRLILSGQAESGCLVNRAKAWILNPDIGEVRGGAPNQVTIRGAYITAPAPHPDCSTAGP